MTQKDYVTRGRPTVGRRKKTARKKHRSSGAPKTLIVFAIALLMVFIGGLYFITHNKPAHTPLIPPGSMRSGHVLPPKPEERWRYIKELENRQVNTPLPPSTTASKSTTPFSLTPEQRQLLEQMQVDMQHPPTQLSEVPSNAPSQSATPIDSASATIPQQSATITAPTSNTETKRATTKPRSEQKPQWMIQCGAFKTTEQAESIRAQLAFSGLESRITSTAGWYRVMLGAYPSRAATESALSRLKNIGISHCIALDIGG